jgi:predicted dehydrogenase
MKSESTTRRDFLKVAGTAFAAGALVNRAWAGGGDTIKVGLIGCGGRGSGAVVDCINGSPNTKIVAIGDVFQHRVDSTKKTLARFKDRTDLNDDRCFVGLDAFEKVIAAGVDMVILATPPGFRPLHLAAAVKAGKHIFTEKPVCVDGPGYRKVIAAYEEALKKGLGIVAGTQRRHQTGYLETMKRVLDGAIGKIVGGRVYWNQDNDLWFRQRETSMTDVAYHCHNWYHFLWTCGDHIVEQHVHNLDVMNWAMQDHPVSAMGMGGRSNRPSGDPNVVGQIYDHFAVEYTFKNGTVINSFCRQINGSTGNVSETFVGTQGVCHAGDYVINGKRVLEGSDNKPYVQEHTDLVKSIEAGKPLNELKQVADSSLTAVLGRNACYTGQVLSWDEVASDSHDTFPENLTWDKSIDVSPAPLPGGARKPRRKK